MDCSPPGSSVHGILQARILEWVAIPSSRGSSQPRDWTLVSGIAGRFFTIWATRETPLPWGPPHSLDQPQNTYKHKQVFHIYQKKPLRVYFWQYTLLPVKYGHSCLGQARPLAFSFTDINSNPLPSKPLGKKLRRLCYPWSYGECLLWVTDTAQYAESELRRTLLGANVGKVCVCFLMCF